MASPGLSRIPGSSGSPGLSSIPIGGGGIISSGSVTRDAVSTGNRSERFQKRRKELMARGMSYNEATSAAYLSVEREEQHIKRPIPLLSAIGKVFKAIESTTAGFAQGVAQSAEKPGFNPVSDIAAGFTNVPKAVGKGYGWGEYLKQEVVADPKKPTGAGKFVYDHAGAIGFSLALVTDPTMYLSFGATSASKLTAAKLMAREGQESAIETRHILEAKGGWFNGVKYADPTELFAEVHKAANRPLTLPQALDKLRELGLAEKRLNRAGQKTLKTTDKMGRVGSEVVPAGLGKRATAFLLPTNVKGRRGVGFAGVAIPGTERLGQALASSTRGKFRKASEEGTALDVLQRNFVTMSENRTMGDDLIRSMVMLERTHLANELNDLERTAKNFGAVLARPAVADELGTIDTSIIHGAERTKALPGEMGPLTQRSQVLRNNIDEAIEREVVAAKKVKLSERATRNLWHDVLKETSDPIEAISHFVWRNRTQVIGRQFIERILDNPLFAYKISADKAKQNLRPGYVPFTDHRKQTWAVLHGLENALHQVKNPQVVDREIKKIMRLMSVPQQFWKAYATSPNPSFHVMNAAGAVFNNLFTNVWNPADYGRAFATVMRAKLMQAGEEGKEKYYGISTEPTPARRAAAQVYEEGQKRSALSSVGFFADLRDPQGGFQRLVHDQPITGKEKLLDLIDPRQGESMKRFAFRQARRSVGTAGALTGNPLLAAAGWAPELVAGGKKFGSLIEDTVRLAPYMKAAQDPAVLRWLDAYGPIRVPGMAHPGYSKQDQALMYDIGADISKHFQFDYGDLTEFERRMAKTVFPFYTYYRKNFVLQAQQLAKAPRGLDVMLKFAQYMNENGDLPEAFHQMLPEYFDNLGAFQIPVPNAIRSKLGLPADLPLFLNPKLPFLSLNLFPPLWDLFRDTGQPDSVKLMATFAPVAGSVGPLAPVPVPGAKMFIESVVGYNLGMNKSMDYQRGQSGDWRNSYVNAPGYVKYLPEPLRDFFGIFPYGDIVESEKKPGTFRMTATGAYILDSLSTPFITNLGKSIPVGTGQDELADQKARADLVSWMTGIRLMPVDVLQTNRSWAYRLRSMLRGRQEELEDQGKKLDPEDRRALRMVERQIDVLERAWDRRERELYSNE